MTALDNQNPVGSGSQKLSQLLASIEERARTSQGYNFTSVVKLDVPALVKALRRALQFIHDVDIGCYDIPEVVKDQISAILEDRADVGEEEEGLEEPGA